MSIATDMARIGVAIKNGELDTFSVKLNGDHWHVRAWSYQLYDFAEHGPSLSKLLRALIKDARRWVTI